MSRALIAIAAAGMLAPPMHAPPPTNSHEPLRPQRMRRGRGTTPRAVDDESLPAEDRERIARAAAKRARKNAARGGEQ